MNVTIKASLTSDNVSVTLNHDVDSKWIDVDEVAKKLKQAFISMALHVPNSTVSVVVSTPNDTIMHNSKHGEATGTQYELAEYDKASAFAVEFVTKYITIPVIIRGLPKALVYDYFRY